MDPMGIGKYAMHPRFVRQSVTNWSRALFETAILYLPRPSAVAADDPYLVGVNVCLRVVVIQLECDICDNESPDFIAETVGFKMAL